MAIVSALTGIDGLLLIHLPNGPTAHFKLTSFKRGRDIRASLHKGGHTCLHTIIALTQSVHEFKCIYLPELYVLISRVVPGILTDVVL